MNLSQIQQEQDEWSNWTHVKKRNWKEDSLQDSRKS